ncbi:hypothetical protein, partial [Rubrivirga sp.]|uniref:hypothetical protein n=1 Tax=Rubrivirga sp. TaxID=1885344 RepID=UPI003C70FB14
IPSPDPSVWSRIVGVDPDALDDVASVVASAPPVLEDGDLESREAGAANEYSDHTVRELRTMARDRDDDDFSGRTISKATKDELIAFLRRDDRRS